MDASEDRYKNVRKCLDEPDPSKRDACLAEATIEHLESMRVMEGAIMDGVAAVRNDVSDIKNAMVDTLLEIEVGVAAMNGKVDALGKRAKATDSRIKNIEKSMATKDEFNVLSRKVDGMDKKIDELLEKK